MTWLGGLALIGNLAPGHDLTAVAARALGPFLTIHATRAASQEAWQRSAGMALSQRLLATAGRSDHKTL
jgi:hypothetical protein